MGSIFVNRHGLKDKNHFDIGGTGKAKKGQCEEGKKYEGTENYQRAKGGGWREES